MKKLPWITLLSLSAALAFGAGNAHADWSKFGFRCVRSSSLGRSCVAPDGRIWSAALGDGNDRLYTNGNPLGAKDTYGYRKYLVVGLDGKRRTNVQGDGYDYVHPRDSDASVACTHLSTKAGINLLLPSRKDYLQLIQWFDHTGTVTYDSKGLIVEDDLRLTSRGLENMYQVFPDMRNNWFWTASVDPGLSNSAFEFAGLTGDVSVDYRHIAKSVRCVSR